MISEIKKLYDVPRNSYIKLAITDNISEKEIDNPMFKMVFHFHHLDGMYSFCESKNNQIYHIAAFAEVNVVTKEDFENQ